MLKVTKTILPFFHSEKALSISHIQKRNVYMRNYCSASKAGNEKIFTKGHLWLEKTEEEDEDNVYYVGVTKYFVVSYLKVYSIISNI